MVLIAFIIVRINSINNNLQIRKWQKFYLDENVCIFLRNLAIEYSFGNFPDTLDSKYLEQQKKNCVSKAMSMLKNLVNYWKPRNHQTFDKAFDDDLIYTKKKEFSLAGTLAIHTCIGESRVVNCNIRHWLALPCYNWSLCSLKYDPFVIVTYQWQERKYFFDSSHPKKMEWLFTGVCE